jgi:hypothetical protein
VYQIENSGDLIKSSTKLQMGHATWPHVSRTVLLLGLTSFFTDVSSEMVSSILQLYMVLTLRMAQWSWDHGWPVSGHCVTRACRGWVFC